MDFKSLATLKKYLWALKRSLIIGAIAIVLNNVFMMAGPRIIGRGIDEIKRASEGPADYRIVIWCVGLFLLATLLQGIFSYVSRSRLISASRVIEYELRNDYFSHIQKMSFSYFDETRTGDLVSRATTDLNAVRSVVGPGIQNSLHTAMMMPAAAFFMFSMSSTLTLWLLAGMLPASALIYIFGKKMHYYSRRIMEQTGDINAVVQENLTGMRVIKAYAREAHEIHNFKEINRELVRRNIAMFKLSSFFRPLLMLYALLGVVFVLTAGGIFVIRGKMSVGDLTAFLMYANMLAWPTTVVGMLIGMLQRGSAAMKRINEVMDVEPAIVDDEHTVQQVNIKGEIEFRNLSFGYSSSNIPVLDGITLSVRTGSTVAVVGPTGCGKTTLAALIPRLYDPPADAVFVDGIDIRRIPVRALRGTVGCVPQDGFLFSDTILENIMFCSNEDRPKSERLKIPEKAIEAARIAGFEEEIESFPDGYFTRLGERGVNLSGGQKQRLGIARAIYVDPRILVLDDALSNVDTSTEEIILTNLKKFMKDRTCLLISHRISTVQHADHIVFLESGRIVEEGTHDELLKLDRRYAQMHRSQLLKRRIEDTE
ncbi:ABC transporter ATP-binding protein [Candidatus Hydrogenedentota bacterium]